MEQLVTIGIIVVFVGILIIIIGSILGAGEGKAKFAFGGFIGPIPIGFANDKDMLYVVIAIAVIMLIVMFLISHKII